MIEMFGYRFLQNIIKSWKTIVIKTLDEWYFNTMKYCAAVKKKEWCWEKAHAFFRVLQSNRTPTLAFVIMGAGKSKSLEQVRKLEIQVS